MTTTGFQLFDRTVQKSMQWIKETCAALGPDDPQRGYHALKAVLQTLRDRLTVDEAANLGAQLPTLIRGCYYEGYRPSRMPVKLRSREEFLGAVGERLETVPPIPSDKATEAVLTVLQRRVSEGEIEDVKAMMPEELRALWPSGGAA